MIEKKKEPDINSAEEAHSPNEDFYAALNEAEAIVNNSSGGSNAADAGSHSSSGNSNHGNYDSSGHSSSGSGHHSSSGSGHHSSSGSGHYSSSGSSHHSSSGSGHHSSSGGSHHHHRHHHHHHHSSRSRNEFWQPSELNKSVRTEPSEETMKNHPIKRSGRRSKGLTVLLGVLIALVSIMAILVITIAALRWAGGRSLSSGEIAYEMITIPDAIKQDVEIKDEGRTVIYKGEKYIYNKDIITILFLGVDRSLESDEENGAETGDSVTGMNGQSDTLVLGVIDKKNEKISFINVSRDTMADIDIYNVDNEFLRSEKRQICLQYAYGDGREKSCEYVVNALKRYLYGMPINAYAAIDYEAIAVLNDAVGGVEVNVLEDLSSGPYAELVKGQNVTLVGDMAEYYCRTRDSYSVDANNYRMARQKQYLMAFMQKALGLVRGDLGFSLELYNTANPYMVTDIGVSEVTYLATTVTGYGIELDAIKSIPGEVVQDGENAAFYADETALYELILNTFYNKA